MWKSHKKMQCKKLNINQISLDHLANIYSATAFLELKY